MLPNHDKMLVEPDKLRDTGELSLKSSLGEQKQKKYQNKKKEKWNVPVLFPAPIFRWHAKSLAPHAATHWSVSSIEGSLPTPVPHNVFLLKPHLSGSFKKAGQAWIWNSKWNLFFSIPAASPLLLSPRNMNRKILSLLFLLYNTRGPPIWLPSVATVSPLLGTLVDEGDQIAATWHNLHSCGHLVSPLLPPGNW